jgi:hypothetical protein
MDVVKDSLTTAMYPEADPEQNQVRQTRLLDLYLNMPDKGSGDTPLHLAAKMGNYEVVDLLTSEPMLDTKRVNKFGESALDVVGSRAKVKSKEVEDKIREAIEGMLYIPVYRELDGIPHLGEPVPQSECNPRQLFRGSASPPPLSEDAPDSVVGSPRLSGGSISSPRLNGVSFTSPRTPRTTNTTNGLNRTFTLSGSSPGSPLSLRKAQGSTGSLGSPMMDQSAERMKSPLFISALIGPLSEKKAASTYKELKSSNVRQRLQDPEKGLERQCGSVAKRIQADFTEYWQFLDAYLDLTSEEGLQRLETHLNTIQDEQVRLEEAARCQELEDEQPANNSVFMTDELAEMEFFIPNKGTPVKVNDANTENTSAAEDAVSTPLSPLTFLTLALDSLDICSTQVPTMSQNIGPSPEQTRGRRPSVQTKEIVDQFGLQFCQSLTENLPQSEADTDIQDWGLTLLNHWEFLRRQVNLMRSDPQGRWSALDYSALACRIIESVQRELEDSVDGSDYTRVQAYLDRIASFKVNTVTPGHEKEPEGISEFRTQRQNSFRDITRLKEIQPLTRLLVYFMENRAFPEKDTLEGIWDLKNSQRISTNTVNKARKYLHSKVFSDSDSNSTVSTHDDFSWVNEPLSGSTGSCTDDNNPTWRSMRRADSMVSLSSQASSQYCTPPSSPVRPGSPALSQASSMLTADEGQIVWMEGAEPTQTDRQVVAALQAVDQDVLQKYPSLLGYFIVAGNYSMAEMKRWPAKPKPVQHMEPRRLNLDMSALNMD